MESEQHSVAILTAEITKYHDALRKERAIKRRLAERLDLCLVTLAHIRSDITTYDNETSRSLTKARGIPFENSIMAPVIRNRDRKLAKYTIDRIRRRVFQQ